MTDHKSAYIEHLFLERSKWEEEIRKNLRGGIHFIAETADIRKMYQERIDIIDRLLSNVLQDFPPQNDCSRNVSEILPDDLARDGRGEGTRDTK